MELLDTYCCPGAPSFDAYEETALLSKEIEKKIYAQVWPTEVPAIKESNPTPAPIIVMEQENEAQPIPLEPAEEPTPTVPEAAGESKEIPLQPAESTEIIEWPYITAPKPPTYTPEPEIMPPQEEPTPTPQPTPDVPANPVDPSTPIPEPTEPSAEPTPVQPAEQPSGGYAECSCGARLNPEEVVLHMKAHAINGESHSYRAY